MFDVYFISPYKKISVIAEKLLSETSLNYKIYNFLSMPTKANNVKVLGDNEAKVIVTRGGLAHLFKRAYDAEIIEIPVNMYDILDSLEILSKTKNYKRVAILTFYSILKYPKKEIKLGDMSIQFFSFKDTEESVKYVKQVLQDNNIEFIIGDSLSCEIAEKNGYPNTLIESNIGDIKHAINQAIYEVEKIDKKKNFKKEILKNGWVAKYTFKDIIGNSNELNLCKTKAKKFAQSNRNLMIIGETGTGKELFAQSIHNESDRFDKPFIPLNCASLSENLIESELFGYEEGSFTGASHKGKDGLFMLAKGGTLFLDEITETSTEFQAKLLRVLQEKKIRKVGGNSYIDINVRIISSSNKDIYSLIENDRFREDLYYRLSELEIEVPTLRNRVKDIPALAKELIKIECLNQHNKYVEIDEDMFKPLMKYEWPGNVRELKNYIIKLVNLCDISNITKIDIEDLISEFIHKRNKKIIETIEIPIFKDYKKMESYLFQKLLLYYGDDKKKLCSDYDISDSTLWRKLNYDK